MEKLINIKVFLFILSHLFIITACQHTPAPTEVDANAIRKVISESFKAAWDKNDEMAMAATFLDDGDLTFPNSTWIRRREAVTQAFNWELPEGRTIQLDIQDIRFLEPTIAIVNVDASFQGGSDDHGNPIPDYWDCATWIMQKQGDEWKTAGMRVMPMRQSQEQASQEIADTWDQFKIHWESGDADKAISFFTQNAVNLGTNTPEHVGRDNISDMVNRFMSNQKPSNFIVEQHSLHIQGPVAFQYGTMSQTWTNTSGKTRMQKARFMTQLQRESDGIWRFRRFMFTDIPVE